ncbi:RNA methyltransferase [Candidatus Peregrinibacteria bacterium CG10_big_fil_rev_8_21_14_0_10_42_8]|nr:MAG: RNA methyltransferase [Candidatus Peregrinibacteria bacterium CG10_big_fil_rev_8_21_14_0_10_42_8]
MEKRIVLLAHNIRSLWNVGSFFRTSDAFCVEKIFLTGYTATPPRREISKTAIGAEEWIKWEYQEDPTLLIKTLKNDGWTILALEITDQAQSIHEYSPSAKTCLVLGHEVTGVPSDILALCDSTVMIPMMGKKESLNVSVAAGIALSHLKKHRILGACTCSNTHKDKCTRCKPPKHWNNRDNTNECIHKN